MLNAAESQLKEEAPNTIQQKPAINHNTMPSSPSPSSSSLSSSMAHQLVLMLSCLALASGFFGAEAIRAPTAPAGVNLTFPPFSASRITCALDKSLGLDPAIVCTPSTPPGKIVFSYDNDVISARYQYNKKVAFWKKGSPFAASFSTSFTLNFDRDAERSVKRVFGGGIAFAITPTIDVGKSGPESFGLFPIDQSNGRPSMSTNPRTVAVEIDTSRDTTYGWDPQIPHVGLDINSVDSVKSRFLWNGTRFIDRKIAVFVDYDASSQEISVRFQNVSANGSPDKRKSKLFLSYSGLDLSKLVNEESYVGFSSRVPITTDGTYILYDWKFSTRWVPRKGVQF